MTIGIVGITKKVYNVKRVNFTVYPFLFNQFDVFVLFMLLY